MIFLSLAKLLTVSDCLIVHKWYLLCHLIPHHAHFYTTPHHTTGMGEEHTAKFKLRMGLNLRTARAYAKLRFRTEPISPFDIGEGLRCAGKVICCAVRCCVCLALCVFVWNVLLCGKRADKAHCAGGFQGFFRTIHPLHYTTTHPSHLTQLPLPVSFLPVLKNIPLRIEYRLRMNAGRPEGEGSGGEYSVCMVDCLCV